MSNLAFFAFNQIAKKNLQINFERIRHIILDKLDEIIVCSSLLDDHARNSVLRQVVE